MSEKSTHLITRQAVREPCYVHARFVQSGALAYVLDITHLGCRFVFQDPTHFTEHETMPVEIMPVADLGIANFMVTVAMHWDRADRPFHAAGASFVDLLPASQAALAALVASFGTSHRTPRITAESDSLE